MSEPDLVARARFAHVERILDLLLELPIEQQAARLERECGGDAALLCEVSALLRAVAGSGDFLRVAARTQRESVGATAAQLQIGERVAAYRIEALIGRGGMGEVYLATRADGRFDQQVAIKLLDTVVTGGVQSFEREQRLLARLQHPGIARLFDAGVSASGRPYMVMEYIEGEHLTRWCAQRQADLGTRLRLFRQICEALAYAHRQLVIHRDLKPHNILVRADGSVVLLDFGIARLLDDELDAVPTQGQQLTPQYAAPEQLAGDPSSTLSDVYALGLLLYELLTARLPWAMNARDAPVPAMALLWQMHRQLPVPPSRQVPGLLPARLLRGDLDAIVCKALRPESEARYASAQALLDDLDAHRMHRPVQARGDLLWYRFSRALRRHWLAFGAVTLTLLSLAGALWLVTAAQRQTALERDAAQLEAARSKAVRDYLSHMFREASRHQGDAPLTAQQVLDQAAKRIDQQFKDDPGTAGQVLHELGELYLYINDYAGAEPLLRRWLAREQQIGNPASAAQVRFALAESLFRQGQTEPAQELLTQAQAFWAADPRLHRGSLLTSRALQSQLLRNRGAAPEALALLEAAVPERLALSGEIHVETAALFTNLGAAYVATGALEQALQSSERALRIWTALDMAGSSDALNTLNNLAVLQHRRGELQLAQDYFERALELRRQLFGASAATAALLNNLAKLRLQTGQIAEARSLSQEALPMAQRFAGDNSLLHLAAWQVAIDSLIADAQLAQARRELDQLSARVTEHFGDLHLLSALVHMSRARWHAASAQPQERDQALSRARSILQELGASAAPHMGQLQLLVEELGGR